MIRFRQPAGRPVALFACLLIFPGCLRNPVTNRREARLVSEASERRIGAETRKRLIEDLGELNDAVLREYVSGVGRRLAEVSDRPRLDFQFTILDSDVVNAFAAPGGFIFVTRGLLQEVESEAELAAILGHEIGHVCAWHSVNMIEKQMGLGVFTTLGAIASGVALGPEAMIALAQTADLFSTLYLLGYSRDYELEADRVGLRYAISAGYKAEAALDFFQRLKTLEERGGDNEWESYLRSHPPTGQRIELVHQYLDRMAAFSRPAVKGTEPYQDVKSRLPRLSPEERGRVEGNRFVHPGWGVSLEIPSDWEWEVHNQTVLASFREKKGGGWGELRRRGLESSMTPALFARMTAQERRWTPLRAREALYPSGYAHLGHFAGSGVLGGSYQIRALFIVRGKEGYVLVCAAPPDRAEDYLVAFETIMRSFQVR